MRGSGYLITVYLVYSAISIGLIWWLAQTLYHNGQVFLDDVFENRPGLAKSVNRLLVIGFYMLNLGYAALLLRSEHAGSGLEAIELLTHKLGVLLVSLAVIHFANMYVFYRIRRRATRPQYPPVPPQGYPAPYQPQA